MGIEFTAKFEKEVSPSTLNEVVRAISSNPDYKPVKIDGYRLSLQYADPKERSTWSEDIEMNMNEREAYLLFHFGSRDAINRFVKLVESVLAANNIRYVLQEE